MKNKLALAIALMLPFSAMAATQYGDWTYNEKLNAYATTEIVYKASQGLIKKNKDGSLQFGIHVPYETCYVDERVPEPLGTLVVVGGYYDFKIQCLGKNEAVIFSQETGVNESIIQALVKNGNVCLSDNTGKLCFSGKGVKDIQESFTP